MENTEINKVLNNLVETLKDGEYGFTTASKDVKDPTLKAQFKDFASQRTSLAAELSREIQREGQKAEESSSIAGTVHRGWINLKSALGGGEKSILNEAERGEDYAVKAYKDALKEPLPQNIAKLLEGQYATVKSTHDKVKALRDSWQSN